MRSILIGSAVVLLAAGGCVSSSGGEDGTGGGAGSGGGGTGGSGGGATGGTGGLPTCSSVLDCNHAFDVFMKSVPACASCLKSSCSTEIDGCGPNGAKCAASVACFADPILADWRVPDGTCVVAQEQQHWPFLCYLTREECEVVRSTEPEGLALFQCMVADCAADCGMVSDFCGSGPPACSTVSG